MDNGVTRRLGGDKPRHYIFEQAYILRFACFKIEKA
jgi:hypothetical protein